MATVTKERARAKPASGFASAAEFRGVLDEALTELDSDDLHGPRLRATGMRMRFELPDLASGFDLAAADDDSHYIQWTYEESEWAPKLRLKMDSDVANRLFQGRESLAVAVARRRIKVSGDPRSTLLYVPALRLLVQPYRAAVRHLLPGLAVD